MSRYMKRAYLIGYIPKYDEINNIVHKGLIYIILYEAARLFTSPFILGSDQINYFNSVNNC